MADTTRPTGRPTDVTAQEIIDAAKNPIAPLQAGQVAELINMWHAREQNGLSLRTQYQTAMLICEAFGKYGLPWGSIQDSIRNLVLYLFRRHDAIRIARPEDKAKAKPFPISAGEARILMTKAGLDYHWFRAPGRNISSYTCQGDLAPSTNPEDSGGQDALVDLLYIVAAGIERTPAKQATA